MGVNRTGCRPYQHLHPKLACSARTGLEAIFAIATAQSTIWPAVSSEAYLRHTTSPCHSITSPMPPRWCWRLAGADFSLSSVEQI